MIGDPTHRRRQLDADLAAGQLQDHALLVLQLHAAGTGRERATGADRGVGSLDVARTTQVQGMPDQWVVDAPIVKPTLMPETVNG